MVEYGGKCWPKSDDKVTLVNGRVLYIEYPCSEFMIVASTHLAIMALQS